MQSLHHVDFAIWLKNHIEVARKNEVIDSQLCYLSRGPIRVQKSYRGCVVNGIRFQITDVSDSRLTQNNGVFLSATTSTYVGVQDESPTIADLTYYGLLDNIYDLSYGNALKISLFKCKWYDIGKLGIREDEYGLLSVNTSRRRHENEPFIIADQAQQCFYIEDPTEPDWSFVLKRYPRDVFDVNDDNDVVE